MTDIKQKTKPTESTYRFIGKPVVRKEDARLTTGRGQFSDDFALDGQGYAVKVRSPHPHAHTRHADTTRAKQMPGVLAALSRADCAAGSLAAIPHGALPRTK